MAIHHDQKPCIGAVGRWTASKTHSGASPVTTASRNPSLAISDLLAGNPAADVDDYIVLRIPRSILNHALAQEYHHMNQTNATAPTASNPSNAADALRDHINDLDRQRTEAQQQYRALTGDNIYGTAQLAHQKGRRNLAKTIGKYATGVAGVGVLTAAGVYAYRAWKLSRGG